MKWMLFQWGTGSLISSCGNLQSPKNQEKGIQNYTGLPSPKEKKRPSSLYCIKIILYIIIKHDLYLPYIPKHYDFAHLFDRLCWHCSGHGHPSPFDCTSFPPRNGKLGTALLKGLGSSLSRPFVAACSFLFSTQNYSARVDQLPLYWGWSSHPTSNRESLLWVYKPLLLG